MINFIYFNNSYPATENYNKKEKKERKEGRKEGREKKEKERKEERGKKELREGRERNQKHCLVDIKTFSFIPYIYPFSRPLSMYLFL